MKTVQGTHMARKFFVDILFNIYIEGSSVVIIGLICPRTVRTCHMGKQCNDVLTTKPCRGSMSVHCQDSAMTGASQSASQSY